MARGKLYPDQFEDSEPRRGLLWVIFCMPGAVVMWFEYMFPGRGTVLASGRRYQNRVVQFMYTMVIYGLLGAGVFFLAQQPSPKSNLPRVVEQAETVLPAVELQQAEDETRLDQSPAVQAIEEAPPEITDSEREPQPQATETSPVTPPVDPPF